MKSYQYSDRLTVLYGRVKDVEITLPSGRVVTDPTPQPDVVFTTIDGLAAALIAVDGGFETATKEEREALAVELSSATEAKRAPK